MMQLHTLELHEGFKSNKSQTKINYPMYLDDIKVNKRPLYKKFKKKEINQRI